MVYATRGTRYAQGRRDPLDKRQQLAQQTTHTRTSYVALCAIHTALSKYDPQIYFDHSHFEVQNMNSRITIEFKWSFSRKPLFEPQKTLQTGAA